MELALNTLPFWSNFILSADLRWSPSLPADSRRQIYNRGTRRRVFAYRQGEQNVNALESGLATDRDTILVEGSKTRGGAQYQIHGLSFTPDGLPYTLRNNQSEPGMDQDAHLPAIDIPGNGNPNAAEPTPEDMRGLHAFLLSMFLQNFKADLRVDGTKRTIEFGPAMLYPNIGGIMSDVTANNAMPYNQNFMLVPEGIVWNPSGAKDSNMTVDLLCAYNIFVPTFTTVDGIDPATGLAYALPEGEVVARSALGRNWAQRWIVNFHGRELGPLSDVA